MIKIFVTDVSFLHDNTVFEACKQTLPDFRLEKINRLKLRSDRNLSLGAWLLLENAVKHFGKNINLSSMQIHKGGKPYLPDFPDVHFSISHSGTMAMCAVSNKGIGADIQLVGNFKEDICNRYFTTVESSYILGNDSAYEKRKRFFEIWTVKEAYSKMTGKGLGDFNNFEVVTGNEICIKHENRKLPFFISVYSVADYKLAICTDDTSKPDFEFVKSEDLLGITSTINTNDNSNTHG